MPLKTFILLFFIIMLLPNCKKDALDVNNHSLIWSNNTYCAFTDLIWYNNKWYCVFREAESHAGTNGFLRLMESEDAKKWKVSTIFKMEGMDIRDPKLFTGFKNELIVSAGVLNSAREFENVLWKFNNASSSWSEPFYMSVKGNWLWRITREGNRMYSIGYTTRTTSASPVNTKISCYVTDENSFPTFKLLGSEILTDGCPSETSMNFIGSKIYMVTRRDCDNKNTWLGISDLSFSNVQWNNLDIILQSPNMINTPHGIYVSGRIYTPGDKVGLFKLDTTKLKLDKVAELPSRLDTGYPGLVYEKDSLWISYYSTENERSRAIYLSAIRLKR